MIFKNAAGEIASGIMWDGAPTTRTDGTPYKPGEHKGYTVGRSDIITGIIKPFVSIPATFDTKSWPLDQLNITEPGEYTIALAAVDSTDQQGAYSETVNFTASYPVPNVVTGLVVF